MRVLYLVDIRLPLERANGIQSLETCHALAQRGHEVVLGVRPDIVDPPRDPLAFYGLTWRPELSIERAPTGGPASLRRLAYLSYALRRIRRSPSVDLVFTRDLGVAAALLRLPRALRPPVAYETHGFAPEVARALPDLLDGAPTASALKLRRLLARERRVWRRAEAYISITGGLEAELRERFGARVNTAVVPDGVRLRSDRRFEPPRPRARPVAAYAGHLYPWKGVDLFLRALATLKGVDGMIVGGHPLEGDLRRLESLAADLGVSRTVTFAGFVAPHRVAAHLSEADVLVLPNPATRVSSVYTSPLKLFEYLAAGRPIVASDLPAIREILSDGETGVLVRPGDPQALAAGIRRVVDDAELGRRLSRGAFDAASEYSWSRRAERLESLFRVVTEPAGAIRSNAGRR